MVPILNLTFPTQSPERSPGGSAQTRDQPIHFDGHGLYDFNGY